MNTYEIKESEFLQKTIANLDASINNIDIALYQVKDKSKYAVNNIDSIENVAKEAKRKISQIKKMIELSHG